jgi:hypothetical protein
LAVLYYLGRTAKSISDRTNELENSLKLALSDFRHQADKTNQHIEAMLKKMDKLDEHQEKIIRIEEREKGREHQITFLSRWREEHEKVHTAHS